MNNLIPHYLTLNGVPINSPLNATAVFFWRDPQGTWLPNHGNHLAQVEHICSYCFRRTNFWHQSWLLEFSARSPWAVIDRGNEFGMSLIQRGVQQIPAAASWTFISLINPSRGASRFYSIANELGLTHRLLNSYDKNIVDELLNMPVDYANVNRKLGLLVEESERFLLDSLKGW